MAARSCRAAAPREPDGRIDLGLGVDTAARSETPVAGNILSGSIVPGYYGVNATLGKIPVLRDIFSGQHGLGVLGIDFSVSGPLGQPQVSVHPLESLTPSIVQRFTDLFGSTPPEKKRATSRKWW